jgi:hypothetical protein
MAANSGLQYGGIAQAEQKAGNAEQAEALHL